MVDAARPGGSNELCPSNPVQGMHHRKNLGSKLSPAIQRLTPGGVRFAPAARIVAEKRAEARMKGYVGEASPECGNFTMVRSGTCLKCGTCGGTTGCS